MAMPWDIECTRLQQQRDLTTMTGAGSLILESNTLGIQHQQIKQMPEEMAALSPDIDVSEQLVLAEETTKIVAIAGLSNRGGNNSQEDFLSKSRRDSQPQREESFLSFTLPAALNWIRKGSNRGKIKDSKAKK